MPSIFLVNDNKIVSRLLQLSSDKHNYLLEEKATVEPSKERYDFVLVDSDKYSPSFIEEIQTKITYTKIGFIGIKNEPVPEVFDMHLDKPFLPSDFVTMIEQNSLEESFEVVEETPVPSKIAEASPELTLDDNIDDLELDEPTEDLESEEALEELDTLEDLDTLLDETIEENPDIDLALDSSSVMSTGVAPQYIQTSEDEDNTPHEELANIINEIEDIDSTKEITLEESKEQLEDLDDLSETIKEDTESDIVNTTLAAGAVTLAGASLLAEDESSKSDSQPDITSLDNLESVEELEKESHYIDKESLAEDMTDNLDTLDEDEINKALGESPLETIVDEKIDHTTEEETLVESNDVQKWIQDAVAKAITPEMIKEALNDMQINITLDFTKKDTQ